MKVFRGFSWKLDLPSGWEGTTTRLVPISNGSVASELSKSAVHGKTATLPTKTSGIVPANTYFRTQHHPQ